MTTSQSPVAPLIKLEFFVLGLSCMALLEYSLKGF